MSKGKFALLALAGLAAVISMSQLRSGQVDASSVDGAWVSVEAQPLERPISAEGLLAQASAVTVTAPFEGSIVQRWVQPGDSVKAGSPLFQLDTAGVEAELREAQSAHIRAQGDLAGLMKWETSAEVTAAQRQVMSAQRQKQTAQTRFNEVQSLLEKGIVARAELDAAKSELESASEQLLNAADGLASARQKGGAEQRQIATLEAESRRAKLRLVQERLKSATITAPVAGVVLKPARSDGAASKELEVGTFVTNREALVVIADNTALLVRASLDEFDAARAQVGMPVEVTLKTDDKSVMQGELVRVSAQARSESRVGQGSGAPMFEIEVLIRNVPEPLRARLRLGTTARLRMLAESQALALTVPLGAVRVDQTGRATVRRKAAGEKSDTGQELTIEPGMTLTDRVVVLKGLAAGDLVWVPKTESTDAPRSGLPPGSDVRK
jgi:HlyD family secretion protein